MSVKTSNKSNPNNSMNEAGASNEGLSSSRCPIGAQDGSGHHRSRLIEGQQEENGLKKRTEW